jgi:hypothetical protein
MRKRGATRIYRKNLDWWSSRFGKSARHLVARAFCHGRHEFGDTVVLLSGGTAREGDAFALTARVEVVVDQLGAVVTAEPRERHRQALADVMAGGADALAAPSGGW